MSGISAFADKSTEQATLKICDLLEEIERPEGVRMTVNNLSNAESGVLRTKDENPVIDISLAHCFTLEDVVRELIKLVAEKK
ncbi:MAG: hypothetical protein KDD15_11840 [Lewinella sp.]|nr:hypothetical protein [Lewinella sp.]